ncbi:MAG: hypothetical protein R2865_10005 [Deinococcales bacterium]
MVFCNSFLNLMMPLKSPCSRRNGGRSLKQLVIRKIRRARYIAEDKFAAYNAEAMAELDTAFKAVAA